MAATSKFSFGDVVLVPFPFTDQSATKKRPAVVVSTSSYNTNQRDLVIMASTGQVRQPLAFGEAMLADWQAAGLIEASVLKPVFATIERRLVSRTMARFRRPTRKRCARYSPKRSAEHLAIARCVGCAPTILAFARTRFFIARTKHRRRLRLSGPRGAVAFNCTALGELQSSVSDPSLSRVEMHHCIR